MMYLLVGCVGIVGLRWITAGVSPRERNLLLLSYCVHLISAALQFGIVEYWYEGGDLLAYHREGSQLAHLLKYDFVSFAPEIGRLVLTFADVDLYMIPGTVFAGSATGSMIGIAGFLHYFLGGSLLASCAAIAVLSFYGKAMVFRAVRTRLSTEMHLPALFALMLVPSVVFWTSGVMKEAIAVIGMGPLVMGAVRVLDRRKISGAFLLCVGAGLIIISKPYVLSALAVALAAASVVATVGGGQIRPMRAIIGVGVTIGIVLVLGQFVPRYSISGLEGELDKLQTIGARVTGGSNYLLAAQHADSLGAQLALAPLALLTTLWRPFLFEVRNPLMLVSALENTVLMWLTYRAFRQHGRGLIRRILSSPDLVAFAVFVIVFGVVVGLASTNLGSLSRYRVPMLPFFVLLVWGLARTAPVPRRASFRPALAQRPVSSADTA